MNLQAISERLLLTREARATFFLNRSIKVFKSISSDYWKGVTRDRSLTDRVEWFDKIATDGICIIPNYLDAETVAALQREIDGIPGYVCGTYTGPMKTLHLVEDGILGLEITEKLPISHRLMIKNEDLASLALALYGPKAHLSGAAALTKYNPDKVDSSNVPHWDDWRVRLKAFLYVRDVTEQNAPMIYIKGSIGDRVPWRLQKDYASRFLPNASAGGSWWPIEQLGFEKVLCTGKAGTLVIFDALGLHAGTQLTGSPRVMLMSTYTTHIKYGFRVY